MTKLEVINAMLATLGELPLNELDARHPYVASGLRILSAKNKSVQLNYGAGFWFNKLDSYVLKPDVEGRVAVPQDLLQFTAIEYPNRYGKVNGFLWDNVNDTDIISAQVEVAAIREISFEDLPVYANDCVSYEAIKTFTRDYDGDLNKVADIKEEAKMSWIALRTQNIRESRANTQRNPQVAAAMAGFRRSTRIPRAF